MTIYDRLEADAYMTPKWCVRSLLNKWQPRMPHEVWEPACGTGNISEVFYEELGWRPVSSDIRNTGYGIPNIDFLTHRCNYPDYSCIITNPPYTLIKEFITRAINTEGVQQVAFLLRHEWDAPKSHRPYLQWPFVYKFILPKRPLWIDGPVKASPRHPYAWYVWDFQENFELNPQIVFLD